MHIASKAEKARMTRKNVIQRQVTRRIWFLGFGGAILGHAAGLLAGALMGNLFDGMVFVVFLAPFLWPGYLVVALLLAALAIPVILWLTQRFSSHLSTSTMLTIAAGAMATLWPLLIILLQTPRGRS